MDIASWAKKAAKANAMRTGNYIRQGRGRLVIRSIVCEEMHGGETFVAEMGVVSSESFADADEKANAPGSIVSYVQQITKRPDVALPNIKAFFLALMGLDEDGLAKAAAAKQMTPEDFFAYQVTKASGEDQKARGMLIDYSTVRKQTKAKDKTLTIPRFSHVPGQSKEDVAQRRAEIEAAEGGEETAED